MSDSCGNSSFFIDSRCIDQAQAKTRPLICIGGFIHDVSDFLDEHPGGRHLLIKQIGRDATTAFFGGVYDHSNAGHNVSAAGPSAIIHTC